MIKEELLIKNFQAGDKRAFSKLYDNYSGALYGIILRICRDEQLAQDLLQETFLKIWHNAHKYDSNKGKFYTWAYRIARNVTLNSMRSRKKLIQTEEIGVYNSITEDVKETVDLETLKGALAALETRHRDALQLVYFQGLTHREAHQEMNVPLGTFKSYVQQALKQLRLQYQITILLVGFVISNIV